MNRRTLLASVSGLAATGLAGCLADADDAGSPADDPSDSSTDTDATASPTATDGSPDATTEASTPARDTSFPPNHDDIERVVWFREVSDPDSALLLEHSAASVSLPDAELSFTLRNDTQRTFATNFYNWGLYRWEAGQWYRVAPRVTPDPLMTVEPGGSHQWTVTLRDRVPGDPIVRTGGTSDVTVASLGGGHYAFAVDGWWEDQEQTPTYEHKTVCAARFELAGDALELVASDAVTDTRREGDTAVVTAESPRDGEGTEATYVLTRDDVSDPERLITEQVYRQWPLRDALAHAGSDVREVRVETETHVTPLFGVQSDETPAVAYDGRTYRISAERRDTGTSV